MDEMYRIEYLRPEAGVTDVRYFKTLGELEEWFQNNLKLGERMMIYGIQSMKEA